MALSFYQKDHFLNAFPLFQETEKIGLFCVFDENKNLIEASYFERSEILNSTVKVRSIEIKADRLIEHWNDFTNEWVGPKGILQIRDKDQGTSEIKWTRELKLKEMLSELVEAYLLSKKTGVSEIDNEIRRKNEIDQHEKAFAKGNFSNWPKSLSEPRFHTWQSLNPTATVTDFREFFETLKSDGSLNDLNEDQLGTALSKWLHGKGA